MSSNVPVTVMYDLLPSSDEIHLSSSQISTSPKPKPPAWIVTDALLYNLILPLIANNSDKAESETTRAAGLPVEDEYGGVQAIASLIEQLILNNEKDLKKLLKLATANAKRYKADRAAYQNANKNSKSGKVLATHLAREGSYPGPKAFFRTVLGMDREGCMKGLGMKKWNGRLVQSKPILPSISYEYSDMLRHCKVMPTIDPSSISSRDRRNDLRIKYLFQTVRAVLLAHPESLVILAVGDMFLSERLESHHLEELKELGDRVEFKPRAEVIGNVPELVRSLAKRQSEQDGTDIPTRQSFVVPNTATSSDAPQWIAVAHKKEPDHELFYPPPSTGLPLTLNPSAKVSLYFDTSCIYYIPDFVKALDDIVGGDITIVVVDEVVRELGGQAGFVRQNYQDAKAVCSRPWIEPANQLNRIDSPYYSNASFDGERRNLEKDPLILLQIANDIVHRSSGASREQQRSIVFTADAGFEIGGWGIHMSTIDVCIPILIQQPDPPAYWITKERGIAEDGSKCKQNVRPEGMLPLLYHLLRDLMVETKTGV